MKKINDHLLQLSSGRIIDGYHNIIGICVYETNEASVDSIFYGKDGTIDAPWMEPEERLTQGERKEIASMMLQRWEEYLKSC